MFSSSAMIDLRIAFPKMGNSALAIACGCFCTDNTKVCSSSGCSSLRKSVRSRMASFRTLATSWARCFGFSSRLTQLHANASRSGPSSSLRSSARGWSSPDWGARAARPSVGIMV